HKQNTNPKPSFAQRETKLSSSSGLQRRNRTPRGSAGSGGTCAPRPRSAAAGKGRSGRNSISSPKRRGDPRPAPHPSLPKRTAPTMDHWRSQWLFQWTKVKLFLGKGPRKLGRCTELPAHYPASTTLKKNPKFLLLFKS
uniref:Uncharacterized protein n=1 Tax=Junco hyemalis TaxID=40217 RepID=A0A8C5NJ23_JUNHY